MIRIREAAVAGSFYPADAGELQSAVRRMLDLARAPEELAWKTVPPAALIVPHAGYVYSGQVAAAAYARLRSHPQRYRRVVLLGPCHGMSFRGLAASSADVFRTPLGDVPLDRDSIDGLKHPAVGFLDAAHGPEHSLEVQLPFLQTVLAPFALVPLVVGDANPDDVAAVIDMLWVAPETLVIVSTDLSHYLGYDQARHLDRATCRAIETLDSRVIGRGQACGATPLRGLLLSVQRRGLQPLTLDLRNSGDTSGSRGQVVGYGAWMFAEVGPCERAA